MYVFRNSIIGSRQDPILPLSTIIEPIIQLSLPKKPEAYATSSPSLPIRPSPARYSPSSLASVAAIRPNAGVAALRTQAVKPYCANRPIVPDGPRAAASWEVKITISKNGFPTFPLDCQICPDCGEVRWLTIMLLGYRRNGPSQW